MNINTHHQQSGAGATFALFLAFPTPMGSTTPILFPSSDAKSTTAIHVNNDATNNIWNIVKTQAGSASFTSADKELKRQTTESEDSSLSKTLDVMDTTISQMLKKLQTLRERPQQPDDFACPSKAAIGFLEDIISLLPQDGSTPKAHIGTDGQGGVQATWRSGRTFLVLSASAGQGAMPDVFFFVRQNGQSEPAERFSTIREYAESITRNLPLVAAKG